MTLGVNIDKQAFLFWTLIVVCLVVPAMGVAEYFDKRTAYLREVALTPVSEWPDMKLKEIAFVLYVCDQNDSLPYYEDVVTYVLSQKKGRYKSVLSCGSSVELGERMSPYLPHKELWIIPNEKARTHRYHKGQPENEPSAYPEWDKEYAIKEPLCY